VFEVRDDRLGLFGAELNAVMRHGRLPLRQHVPHVLAPRLWIGPLNVGPIENDGARVHDFPETASAAVARAAQRTEPTATTMGTCKRHRSRFATDLPSHPARAFDKPTALMRYCNGKMYVLRVRSEQPDGHDDGPLQE
jgi:hypothetical protein